MEPYPFAVSVLREALYREQDVLTEQELEATVYRESSDAPYGMRYQLQINRTVRNIADLEGAILALTNP